MSLQFWAILIDSYRLLKSAKLFWLSFILSAIFGIAYLSIGSDSNGLTMLFGLVKIDMEYFANHSDGYKMLYYSIFDTVIIGFLLTWVVPILGLISVSPLFPDFMKEGAIDVALSKPISRMRLFAYKYLGGLLFVLLQVSVFAVFVYFCLGIRLNQWGLNLFLMIPIVTLVFSYLYVVNVLLGVFTRSPIVALTITLGFWFLVWGFQSAEVVMHQFKIGCEMRAESLKEQQTDDVMQQRLAKQLQTFKICHTSIYYVHMMLPKIQETTDLTGRYIVPDSEEAMMKMMADNKKQPRRGAFQQNQQALKKWRREYKERSLWYVIGTSLLFELVCFALAGYLFCRRDY